MVKEKNNSKEKKEILEKIGNYYKEKLKDIQGEEREYTLKKILYDAIDTGLLDNNSYLEILTEEEKKSLNKEIKLDELIDYFVIFTANNKLKNIIHNILLCSNYKDNKEYAQKFKTEILEYKKILIAYKNLAEELKLYTSEEKNYLFSYLLWNGYFSETKKHIYKQEKTNIKFPQSSVLLGQGVCRDYSAVMDDYLKVCGYDSILTGVDVPLKKGEITYNLNENKTLTYLSDSDKNQEINKEKKELIKRETKKLPLISELITYSRILKRFGNHEVNIISGENGIYGYDSTNLAILSLEKENNKLYLKIVNGTGRYKVIDFWLELENKDEYSLELLKQIRNQESFLKFDENKVKEKYDKTLELLNNSIPLLNNTYESILPSIKEVNEHYDEMKKIKILDKKSEIK